MHLSKYTSTSNRLLWLLLWGFLSSWSALGEPLLSKPDLNANLAEITRDLYPEDTAAKNLDDSQTNAISKDLGTQISKVLATNDRKGGRGTDRNEMGIGRIPSSTPKREDDLDLHLGGRGSAFNGGMTEPYLPVEILNKTYINVSFAESEFTTAKKKDDWYLASPKVIVLIVGFSIVVSMVLLVVGTALCARRKLEVPYQRGLTGSMRYTNERHTTV